MNTSVDKLKVIKRVEQMHFTLRRNQSMKFMVMLFQLQWDHHVSTCVDLCCWSK